tara:strand:+ start:585 stop:1127 length:543 start_codon:yes stop_codon:yes gene_type:complete
MGEDTMRDVWKYLTLPRARQLARAAYPVAARRDDDEHDEVSNRIDVVVESLAGIINGTFLKALPPVVAAGKADQTRIVTLSEVDSLKSYSTRPLPWKARLASYKSQQTGHAGPIGRIVIPALQAGWLVIPGLSWTDNLSGNRHNPVVLRADGNHTIAVAATVNVDARTVAVTTYIRELGR